MKEKTKAVVKTEESETEEDTRTEENVKTEGKAKMEEKAKMEGSETSKPKPKPEMEEMETETTETEVPLPKRIYAVIRGRDTESGQVARKSYVGWANFEGDGFYGKIDLPVMRGMFSFFYMILLLLQLSLVLGQPSSLATTTIHQCW